MADTLYNDKIAVVRFINQPVSSNSYVIYDSANLECIIIDPGSKNPDDIYKFVLENSLSPRFILLTHEHFDHVWGVNKLQKPEIQLVCSKRCSEKIAVPQNYFNSLYYDSSEYYQISKVDIIVEERSSLKWNNVDIEFIYTPGHSIGSVCISINRWLFTGDTVMNGFKPLIKRRHEGSIDDFRKSIELIFDTYPLDTLVYPGHGEPFTLNQVESFYRNY